MCLILDKVEVGAGPCPQILARRKLADISNVPQNWKSQPIPTTITKEYVEQLRKVTFSDGSLIIVLVYMALLFGS